MGSCVYFRVLVIGVAFLLLACHSRTHFEQTPLTFEEVPKPPTVEPKQEEKFRLTREQIDRIQGLLTRSRVGYSDEFLRGVGSIAQNNYFAKRRPVNEYTLRLNFKHECHEVAHCSRQFGEDQWREIMDNADSMSIQYSYFPNPSDDFSLIQIRQLDSRFPLFVKGYTTPLIYEGSMRHPYNLRDTNYRLYHTTKTTANPLLWALEVEEQEGTQGTAVTLDPLVNFADRNAREQTPLRYPIRFYKFSEIFPNQKQYQLDTNCVKRDIRPYQTAASLGLNRIDPNINPLAQMYHPPFIPGLGDAGLNVRGFYQNGNERILFPQVWGPFTEEHYYLSIQDAACFQIDPSKPDTPRVIAEALQNHIQNLSADGIITDNFGGSGYHPLVPFGTVRWGAIPWRTPRGEFYWIQSSESLSSSHFRPKFDNEENPASSYARAFLNFAAQAREIFERSAFRKNWFINLNAIRPMFSVLPKLSQRMEWIKNHLGEIWDEKFAGKGGVATNEGKKEIYVSLAAAYEASRQGKSANLSGLFFNYNDIARENYDKDRDPWGNGKRFSVERVISHYLLVLQKPTIQIHWDRRAGYIPYPNNTYEENYFSTDIFLEKLVRQNTWIRFFSALKAGRPLMETGAVTGFGNNPYQLMYRQFENVLVLSNMTNQVLAAKLPRRHCNDCNPAYIYIRMNHWDGTNPDDLDRIASDYWITPPSKLLTDQDNEGYLAKLDRYAPGDAIYISPGASLVFYNQEALPFDTLPQGVERFNQRYLTTQILRNEAINANQPIQLPTQNYRFFLEVPPELDELE